LALPNEFATLARAAPLLHVGQNAEERDAAALLYAEIDETAIVVTPIFKMDCRSVGTIPLAVVSKNKQANNHGKRHGSDCNSIADCAG